MKIFFKHTIVIALMLLLVFVLTGCVKKSPDKIISDMLVKMAKVDSYHYQADINLKGRMSGLPGLADSEGTSDVNSTEIQAEGDMDWQGDELKHDGNLRIKAQVEGEALDFDLDLRSLEQTTYLRLIKAPVLGTLDLTTMLNKWYKFNYKQVMAAEDPEDQLTSEQIKQLRQLMSNTKFFDLIEDLGKENLDGTQVYHYKVRLNKENIKQFVLQVHEITEGQSMPADDVAELDQKLDGLRNDQGELWVGVKDSYLYRAKGSADFNHRTASIITAPAETEDFDISGAISMPSSPSPSDDFPGRAFIDEDMMADWEKMLEEFEDLDN
jgi:hypothetical protein